MAIDGRRKVTPQTLEKMRKLRSQGMTYQRIAKELNLSIMTVYNYINKQGNVAAPVRKERLGFFASLSRKFGLE